jgi:peptidoglycan hydrolase-like protein with peptidoglycan-binding domain
VRRTLLSLAMAAALLFPVATSRPVAADTASCAALVGAIAFISGPYAAVIGGGVASSTSICSGPFGAAPSPCDITQVGASASNGGNGHHYDYVMLGDCGGAHVIADYDVITKRATEQITSSLGTVTSIFSCQGDPWSAPSGQTPACDWNSRSSSFVNTTPDPTYPSSVTVLSDNSRAALNGQLQNAIKQLQSSANTAPTGTIHSTGAGGELRVDCPNGTHDPQLIDGWPHLDLCSTGRAVAALHFLMSEPGFVGGDLVYFSPRWVSAVNQWDQARGVPADGTVGPVEWRGLTDTVQNGSQGNAVEAVQLLLRAGGETVAVDGNFGPQTDAAVQDYQTNHNLAVDGVVGPQTWQSLLSGS